MNSSLFSFVPFVFIFSSFNHASLSAPLLLGEFSCQLHSCFLCYSYTHSDSDCIYPTSGHVTPPPQSLIALLSSLTVGDSERKTSAIHQREPAADILVESPGLVQRCVVVQKDQLGFGFTVCGERIKLVQNVRQGGAAAKAGVQEGDRIIKVNGSPVSSMSHQEVVKLIKSGPYVAMTLQGPPPSAASLPLEPLPTDLTSNQRSSLSGDTPPPPPPPLPSGMSSTPTQRITGPKPLQDPEVQKHATEILRKMLEQEEAELQPSFAACVFSSFIYPALYSFLYLCSYFYFPFVLQMDGPFQDIELLKSRPAHMMVFMRYIFTQLIIKRCVGLQDHYFFFSQPLKIKVREEYLTDIESRLHAQEDIRGPLSELQQQVLPDIQDQIQDYRNKQMMGLGSLFGEGDLQHLDGDPAKERQVVDKQVTALWEILRCILIFNMTSWFLWPQLSGMKKEKDGEDKKRNPILKYIGKPRATSHSIRPGNVRNIIQQFENHTEPTGEEGGDPADPQRLSSSSLGEESMDGPTVSVRLARSESLKAQGEGRRRGGASGTESVPRSRSDVDMEDCGEEREGPGLRLLQHSASSSASSSSARSVDSPLALLPDAAALEDEVCDTQNWQETVSPQLLTTLSPREVDRQAVIYELFTTEVSHLRTLRVLDQVFFQKMRSVLNSDELACIFPNLPQVYELHASLCEAMKKRRETPIVQDIGDVMLARFEGAAGDEFQEQAAQLCSQQSQALELIKNKQRKDPRFAHIIQECEASPHCRRLQLKDLLVSEMQRLTKYPLLLDNIIKHTEAGTSDLPSLQRAQACCRGILQAVNEVVRETEHRQRLSQYQRRLDAAPQFKSLDLTTKRMIHEGPLTWKVNKDKQIEIQALLLSDCLVLLQRGPDDRLQLRYPSRWLGGGGVVSGDSKTSFSPLVRLDSLLVRSVATDNKALYIISTTERQIYELVQSDSMETHSSNNIDHDDTPTDQSEAFICDERQGGVAEAALQDGERAA
uniref:Rho guanine nucleotide exchange factor (GEF) 11 n=1 Tax=Mastacembelus armatus TaxID=205130 RepID=A0A7N8X1E4_9TELE